MVNDDCVMLGYEAARQLASRIDAGNANEFAAHTIANDVHNAIVGDGVVNFARIVRLQDRCRLDLSSILLLDEKDQCKALALFAGGALQFFQDNPD
jgi:hypothetical protein